MNQTPHMDREVACRRADRCLDWGVPTVDQPFIAAHLLDGELVLTADSAPTSAPTRNVAIERRQDGSVYLWMPEESGRMRNYRMDVDGVPAAQLHNIPLATSAFGRGA